jgi:tripartite ATP-independent transporter DctP family solute receptor
MKKTLSLFLVVAMVVSLLACNKSNSSVNSATEKPVTLLAAALANNTHPYGMAMLWAEEWLEQNNSTVRMDVQLGGVLGGDREVAEGVISGAIDIGVCADMTLSQFFPKLMFANFPGLFKDYDEVRAKYWNGWVGAEVSAVCQAGGLEVLTFVDNGFRWVTNSKRPITKTSDFKGLAMRVPEVQFIIDFFNELGSVCTPITFGELAAALQQKVVDGQDNALSAVYPYSFYEFNHWLCPTNHSYSSGVFFINQKKWNSLTAKQQQDLKAAWAYAAEKEIAYNLASYPQIEKDMVAKAGNEITTPDPQMAQDFIAIGKKLANSPSYLNVFGPDLVKKMYP